MAFFGIFGPVARALAKRIEGRAPSVIGDAAVDQLAGSSMSSTNGSTSWSGPSPHGSRRLHCPRSERRFEMSSGPVKCAGQGGSSAGTLIHQAEKSPDLPGVGQDMKLTHMDRLLHGEGTGDGVLEYSSPDAMPV